MTKLNGTDVVFRENRPAVLSKVLLRAFFLQDGAFQDPNAVSAVSIFTEDDDTLSLILVASSQLVGKTPLMQFENSSVDPTNAIFDTSNYTAGTGASGIFKLGTGQFGVVLDGTVNLSGVYNGSSIANSASAANTYKDVWTVRYTAGSDYQTVFHDFSLFTGSFISTTEPLLITTRSTLQNKKIQNGSKVDLKILTELFVGNKNIPDNVRNIFKQTVMDNVQIKITKINHENSLASRVVVSSFADTSAFVDVTSENTAILNWDTVAVSAISGVGTTEGEYRIQLKATILNETILSPEFPLMIV